MKFVSLRKALRRLFSGTQTVRGGRRHVVTRRQPIAIERLESRQLLASQASLSQVLGVSVTVTFNGEQPSGSPSPNATSPVSWKSVVAGQSAWGSATGDTRNAGLGSEFKAFVGENAPSIAVGTKGVFGTFTQALDVNPTGVANEQWGRERANRLTAFWHQYGPTNMTVGFGNGTLAAAFQLGVWELMSETQGGTPDLAAGRFQVSAAQQNLAAVDQARRWLEGLNPSLAAQSGVVVSVLTSPTLPDQLTVLPKPPEPGKPADGCPSGLTPNQSADVADGLLNTVVQAMDSESCGLSAPISLQRTQAAPVAAPGILANAGVFPFEGAGLGGFGNGWSLTAGPTLAIYGSDPRNPAYVSVIFQRTDTRLFRNVPTGGQPIFYFANGQGTTDSLSLAGGQYIFRTAQGDSLTFYDFDPTRPASQRGQLISRTDAAGNSYEFTYGSDGVTQLRRYAKSSTSTADLIEIQDYTRLPTGHPNEGQVSRIDVRRGNGTLVRSVSLTYHDGTTARGVLGDLAEIETFDPTGNLLDTQAFRYVTSASGASLISYSFNSDSVRRARAGGLDLIKSTDDTLAPFATNHYEYDTQHRVIRHDRQGAGCSSCTSGIGTFFYAYDQNSNPVHGSTQDWRFKTTETRPDGSQRIIYTNALSRTMLEVLRTQDGGVTRQFGTYTRYDARGNPIWQATPEAVAIPADLSTLDQYPDLLNEVAGNFQYLNDFTGLINVTSYFESTTATSTVAGGVDRLVSGLSVMRGDRGTAVRQQAFSYFLQSAGGRTATPLATSTTYPNTTTTGAQTTSWSYTFAAGTTRVVSQRMTLPVVSTTQNGPGRADVSERVFDSVGREIWTRDADGFLQFTRYDTQTGAVIQRIVDVDTTRSADFQDLPIGWTTPVRGGLHLTSTFEVDALGRTTRETDPLGNVTQTVYDDINRAARIYVGWNATTASTTGPIELLRRDLSGSYIESLTYAGTPTVDSQGRPTGQEPITNLQSLSRAHRNSAGQVVAEDRYTQLAGLVYSSNPDLGVEGIDYLRTRSTYDNRGQIDRVQNPAGTITHYIHDGLSRLVGVWIGTDDSTTNGFKWTPANASPSSNMIQVAAYEFDNGGVGNGNLTRETLFPGGGAEPRITQHGYDWRGRLVVTKTAASASPETEYANINRPLQYRDLDNLGRMTGTRVYDGDGLTIADLNGDGVPDQPDAAQLRGSSVTLFDTQNRPYRTQSLFVDQTMGAVGPPRLTTNVFRDRRGNVVATYTPNGPVTQSQYDGAGRLKASYTLGNVPSATWANATSLSASMVLEQSEFTYDAAGNVILTASRQRFHDASTTLLGTLGTPTTGILSRVSYVASYHDAARRPTASVNVGTNGGVVYVRPATVPGRSDSALVTTVSYDAAGRIQDVTDPNGITSRTLYDALGRTTAKIDNFTGGAPAAQSDVTTLFQFDSAGRLMARTAVQPAGTPSQVTGYVYGVSTASGSGIASNDFLAEMRYPDPVTGLPSAAERDVFTTNALGDRTSFTDRAGTRHAYTHDVAGRLTADAVTVLGAGVLGSVRRIQTEHDTLGRLISVTSFDDPTAGIPVNQVTRAYNGFGQVTSEWQSHTGVVDFATTPRVQYTYSQGSGGNHSRLTRITNPDGYAVNFVYSGVDAAISRLTSLTAQRPTATTVVTLESLKYLGLGTVIERSRPEVTVTLSMVNPSATVGTAGDKYTGLDRFGRVVEQRWAKGTTATAQVVDRYVYTYDRNGNRLTRSNLLAAAFSETYQYDALNQLQTFARSGGATTSQRWQFDALGNWTTVTTNSVTQQRAANAQNELTQVGGSSLAYSDTGNLTIDAQGRTLAYDAWNRLVSVTHSNGTQVARYEYDGMNRRIVEQVGKTDSTADASVPVRDVYYSLGWQVLEERVRTSTGVIPSTADARFVWSPVYIDAMILRDRNADGNSTTGIGGLEQRVYALQDATWNTTAIIAASGVSGFSTGAVINRFVYTPYGESQMLTATWTQPVEGSTPATPWAHLFQGLEFTEVTALAYVRHRDYSANLGRFIERDPIGFEAADNNLYRMVFNAPINLTDPLGLRTKIPWDDYFRDFLKNHPNLTKAQRDWVEKQLARGCVGVTCVNLGGRESHKDCYKTKAQAEAARQQMNAANGKCNCLIFSVHFWNDTGIDPKKPDVKCDPVTGKCDLDNWDRGGRPPGPWNPGGGGGVNFDYGFPAPDGSIYHADQYHNPDRNGDGKGDYYPDLPIRNATIYVSTLKEWQASYADFNFEVWCIQCQSDKYGQ
jgi:RHS repeat-associated protein